MGMQLNTKYLTTNRGIIKIAQIVLGVILSGLLCASFTNNSCYGLGHQVSYNSSINFLALIINIVFFVLNLVNIDALKLEKYYSLIGTILFIIGFALLIWFIVTANHTTNHIIAAVIVLAIGCLFVWDYKILHGEASN